MDRLNIGITGMSGFIGSALANFFTQQGYAVKPIKRNFTPSDLIEFDVIINLAGKNINCNWNNTNKREILESRVTTTRHIINSLNNLPIKQRTIISASAIGFYESFSSTNEVVRFSETEYCSGRGFLSEVCKAWESEIPESTQTLRTVICRFGLVLSPKSEIIKKMSALKFISTIPVPDSGNQIISWTSLDDLCRAILFIITNSECQGVFNITNPQTITNNILASYLLKNNRIKIIPKIPKRIIKIAFGERSELVLNSQDIYPERLLEKGFIFNSTPDLLYL
jgi:uncharacterized protein (TIGR01777 family)